MVSRTYILAIAILVAGGFSNSSVYGQKIEINFDLPNDSLIVIETPEPEFSTSRLERLIRMYVNDIREEHRLAELKHNEALDPIARSHSRDMGERNYFDHTNLAGDSPTIRGHRAGFVCRLTYNNIVATGLAENLFYTYAYSSVSKAYLRDKVRLTFDWKEEDQIAREVAQGWYDSPPHRVNLLNERSRSHGIGVYISRDRKIVVTQNIC